MFSPFTTLEQKATGPIIDNVTLYQVLRDHATGAIRSRTSDKLKSYQEVILNRIEELEFIIRNRNLLKGHRAELASDLRWLGSIRDELAVLLTAEFHSK